MEKSDTKVNSVLAVPSQQTQAGVVFSILLHFLRSYPCWASIAQSNQREVERCSSPLIFGVDEQNFLKTHVSDICSREDKWYGTREKLRSMPALDQDVVSANLLFVHGEPEPLMESSMPRLFRRYSDITPEKADVRYDHNLNSVAEQIPRASEPFMLIVVMRDFTSIRCCQHALGCDTRVL